MLALLTVAGCAAVGGAAWHAQARAAESIRRGVFERLTSIREAKRREITAYLEDTCSRTEMLARMPGIVEAMRELAASFGTIEATEQDRPAVLEFYQEEIGPRLNGGKSDVDPATLAPSDPAALAAQAAFIARNPHPVGEKMNLSDPGDASAYARQHARFHPVLRDIQRTLGYYDLFLIEPVQGRVVYSVFKETDFGTRLVGGPHEGSGLGKAFQDALRTGPARNAVLVDFRRYVPSYLAPAAFVAVPVVESDEVIGVLAVQLPVDRLNRVMTGGGSWREDGLGESGETYLVGPDKLMRSDSRFLVESPERFFGMLREHGLDAETIDDIEVFGTTILFQPVDTEASRRALAGHSGTEIVDDYRGIPVLSSYAPLSVAGLDWALLSEIDASEAFAPVATLRRQIGLLTAGVVAAFIVAALTVSKVMSRSQRLAEERQRIDHDLGIARSIQQGLLPQTSPDLPGYDVAGWNQPADQTGGDYFDWQPLPDNRLAVSLADVTGHGIGPALVTAVCRAYARASFAQSSDLGRILSRINSLLHADLPPDRFVTFVVGVLDGDRHHIDLLSAGHGPQLVFRARTGEVEVLGAHGIPLGVMDEVVYEAGDHLDLEPGDVVLLMTDGFFEWRNESGRQFGIARMRDCLAQHAGGSAATIIAQLYRSVREFVGRSPQQDDLTAIAIKRAAPALGPSS